jgi:hypothetical protein
MPGRDYSKREKCGECDDRVRASGKSKSSRKAGILGLCQPCYGVPKVRTKWRKKLGITKDSSGKPLLDVPQDTPGMAAVTDIVTERMIAIVEERLETLTEIRTELGETLGWMIPRIQGAHERVDVLRARALAADALAEKLEEKGFEVDAMLTRFGMSVQELKQAIRASERHSKEDRAERRRIAKEAREAEEEKKRGRGDGSGTP